VDQRLQLARAAKSTAHGVVHERHLPTHGLTERGNGLLRHAVGLSEPDGNLRHRGRAQAQILATPDQQGQEPEEGDWSGNGREGHQGRRPADGVEETGCVAQLPGDEGPGEGNADGGPHTAGRRCNDERFVRGALIEGVDQPANGRCIVVGRNPRAGRTCGPTPGSPALDGVSGKLPELRIGILAGLGRFEVRIRLSLCRLGS